MGIKNLTKLIKKFAPETIQHANLSDFNGKKFAIDTSIYMYRFMFALKCNKIPDASPVEGFIRQATAFVNNGIIPIYVFDGKPPKEKKHTIEERIVRKEKTSDKIEELNEIKKNLIEKIDNKELIDKSIVCTNGRSYTTIAEVDNEIYKLDRRVLEVSYIHFEQCKEIFRLMGIPYIVASGEAEGLCARLVKEGFVDAAVSEDTDLYPCGSPLIIKDLNPDKGKISVCNFRELLVKLDITYEQLVDICILCGCDYLKCSIKGIGPFKAFQFIKELGSIEKIIDLYCGEGKRYKVPDSFDYHSARTLFFESGFNTDLTDFKIKMNTPDIDELILFCNRFFLTKKLKNYLEKYYFTKAQTLIRKSSIEDFFHSRVSDKKKSSVEDFFHSRISN